MNNIDKSYQELIKLILNGGTDKEDRTGTGTKSIFGYQIRHKMSEGFPILTLKKLHWKSIVIELLWFLSGRTDLRYLLDRDVHIWTGDAYKKYLADWNSENPPFSGPYPKILGKKEFEILIMDNDGFNTRYGDLGPIYGKQWRFWNTNLWTTQVGSPETSTYIDQIYTLIEQIKHNPDSRRLMVNAWNVGDLENMTLPPCHYGFQCYTRELNLLERSSFIGSNRYEISLNIKSSTEIDDDERLHRHLDDSGVPRRELSLMWNQRSVDVGLGLPFNIASYGLLLEILAREVGMVPGELIGNLGDCHLYSNHIEGAIEILKRDPYVLPKLDIRWELNQSLIDPIPISNWNIDQFRLNNYEYHPHIKMELSN